VRHVGQNEKRRIAQHYFSYNMKTHNWNIAVATLAATLFAAAALSAHTSVSVSIGVPAPVVVAAPAPAPIVVAQAPAPAQVVVAAPAPVPATVVVQQPVTYYPEYYTWDGFEYVGVIGGNYFYLGAGNMWISCEPWRAHRFHEWEHYHQDWHRRAIHNEHYRHGPPPPPRR
jgi:hypothetical protein